MENKARQSGSRTNPRKMVFPIVFSIFAFSMGCSTTRISERHNYDTPIILPPSEGRIAVLEIPDSGDDLTGLVYESPSPLESGIMVEVEEPADYLDLSEDQRLAYTDGRVEVDIHDGWGTGTSSGVRVYDPYDYSYYESQGTREVVYTVDSPPGVVYREPARIEYVYTPVPAYQVIYVYEDYPSWMGYRYVYYSDDTYWAFSMGYSSWPWYYSRPWYVYSGWYYTPCWSWSRRSSWSFSWGVSWWHWDRWRWSTYHSYHYHYHVHHHYHRTAHQRPQQTDWYHDRNRYDRDYRRTDRPYRNTRPATLVAERDPVRDRGRDLDLRNPVKPREKLTAETYRELQPGPRSMTDRTIAGRPPQEDRSTARTTAARLDQPETRTVRERTTVPESGNRVTSAREVFTRPVEGSPLTETPRTRSEAQIRTESRSAMDRSPRQPDFSSVHRTEIRPNSSGITRDITGRVFDSPADIRQISRADSRTTPAEVFDRTERQSEERNAVRGPSLPAAPSRDVMRPVESREIVRDLRGDDGLSNRPAGSFSRTPQRDPVTVPDFSNRRQTAPERTAPQSTFPGRQQADVRMANPQPRQEPAGPQPIAPSREVQPIRPSAPTRDTSSGSRQAPPPPAPSRMTQPVQPPVQQSPRVIQPSAPVQSQSLPSRPAPAPVSPPSVSRSSRPEGRTVPEMNTMPERPSRPGGSNPAAPGGSVRGKR